MAQRQVRKSSSSEKPVTIPEEDPLPKRAQKDSEAQQLDDLLDEIDAVLEQNAEEFVKAYVQSGGE